MVQRGAPSRSRTRASDTACRSIVFWNTGKRLSMSVRRDLEHGETPKRVVSSRSRTRPSHFACRFVEVQNPAKPQVMQLNRNPELGQATGHAVESRSRLRPSHFACRFDEVQTLPKPHCVPFRRDPEPAQATSHAVVSKFGTRPSHFVCGCNGIQIAAQPLCVRLYRDPDPHVSLYGNSTGTATRLLPELQHCTPPSTITQLSVMQAVMAVAPDVRPLRWTSCHPWKVCLRLRVCLQRTGRHQRFVSADRGSCDLRRPLRMEAKQRSIESCYARLLGAHDIARAQATARRRLSEWQRDVLARQRVD